MEIVQPSSRFRDKFHESNTERDCDGVVEDDGPIANWYGMLMV
jgi:hypothetical protein